MIYMLTRQFKIELSRPFPTSRDKSRLALWEVPFYVGFHPTLIYVAPSGLSCDKQFGSTRVLLPKKIKGCL